MLLTTLRTLRHHLASGLLLETMSPETLSGYAVAEFTARRGDAPAAEQALLDAELVALPSPFAALCPWLTANRLAGTGRPLRYAELVESLRTAPGGELAREVAPLIYAFLRGFTTQYA